MSVGALRALAFSLPALGLVLAVALVGRRPRQLGGMLLAFTWNLGALPLVNALAQARGWWTFGGEGQLLLGTPFDLLLGWAFLWGPLALVISRRVPLPLIVGFALFADWVFMPALAPLLTLGEGWLWGELLLLALCLVPGLLFGTWTWEDRALPGRVVLHLGQFATVMGVVLPHSILVHSDGSWAPLAALSRIEASVALQVLALCGLPALSAVLEFAERGRGTPVPFDGPKRLVTSGPYAYVRNPMQVGTALCFLWLGALLGSPWVAGVAAMAFAYGLGFAAWHEDGDLDERFGAPWRAWQTEVRPWLPRWRPAVHDPATLWVAQSCGPCRAVGQWFEARAPVGLRIAAAEDHALRLVRVRYETSSGHVDDGVGALARALEHLNLAWALVGFAARIPGPRHALQVLIDASGGAPRVIEPGPGK